MSKENINLPKTSFSMKANLPNKEPEILKIWESLNLYKEIIRSENIHCEFEQKGIIQLHNDERSFEEGVKDAELLRLNGIKSNILIQKELKLIEPSIKSNIYDNNIINAKSEVKKWLSKKVNIFGLYKHEYYNKKEDFQFKVGVGVKL